MLKGHSEKMSLQNRILDLERRLSDMSDKTNMIAAESNYKVSPSHTSKTSPHRHRRRSTRWSRSEKTCRALWQRCL